MSSAPLERIGHYRILASVYTGQATRTLKAYDDSTKTTFAIKQLLPKAAGNRFQVNMLKWEYTIGSCFSCGSMIHAHEYGKDRGVPYLVMDWFPGPSVKQLIHLGYSQYCPVLPDLIPKLLEPLIALHEAGYVHRDIKPDNYLYAPELGVKLIDFALVRKKGGFLDRFFHRRGVTQGTATYMSPEQIRNQPLDGRADLYSLGASILELLTGTPPVTGNSMNELLNKHLSGPVPSALAKNKNVTPEFNALLQSMMAKKRENRPVSARAVSDTLRRMKLFVKPPQSGDKTL